MAAASTTRRGSRRMRHGEAMAMRSSVVTTRLFLACALMLLASSASAAPASAAVRIDTDVVFGTSRLDDGSTLNRVMDVIRLETQGEGRPAIVFLHGNPGDLPYPFGRQHGFREFAQYFASRGYVCFVVAWDLRNGDSAAFAIIEMAVSHVRANAGKYGFAPDRIAVIGHSYGSRHACTLATANFVKEEARVQACVMLAGGMSYPGDCDPHDGPILLIYGTADGWFQQAPGIISHLEAGSVPHAYVEVPGARHKIPPTDKIAFDKTLAEVIDDFLTITLPKADADREKTALKLLVTGHQGNGRIVIDGGASHGLYPRGAHVKVTAVPEPGFVFFRWEGDSASSDVSLDITMDTNKHLTAVFVTR